MLCGLPDGHGDGLFRVDQCEQTDRQVLDAVRIEPAVYERQQVSEKTYDFRGFTAPLPVELQFLELPLLSGDEDPVAPYVAVSAVPWPGSVALYSSAQDSDYALNRLVTSQATIGLTLNSMVASAAGLYDRGAALRVQLIRGSLSSVSSEQLLSGSNVAAIGDGSSSQWEVFQFEEAELVAENTYDLRMRLRGQAGTDGIMPDSWPEGSVFVLLDSIPEQIDLASSARGVTRHYRYGPGTRPLGDASYQYRSDVFNGVGLRPYRVAHIRAAENGTSWDLSWVRRTRIGGDLWEQEDVPLSEAAERYNVRVFRDGALVRSATVTEAEWSYTAAMQNADGAGAIRVDVAQVSDLYGEGPSASITIAA